jgi:hypothetical protein
MPSTTKRYPFSTQSGQAIPYDIAKPTGFAFIPFSAVASASLALPADNEVLSLTCTEDCYVQFGGVAAVPSAGVIVSNLLFLRKTMRYNIAPPLASLTVIRSTADGVLHVQLMEKWASIILESQVRRK